MGILASFCVKFHRIKFPRFPVKSEQKISTSDTDRHSEIRMGGNLDVACLQYDT